MRTGDVWMTHECGKGSGVEEGAEKAKSITKLIVIDLLNKTSTVIG